MTESIRIEEIARTIDDVERHLRETDPSRHGSDVYEQLPEDFPRLEGRIARLRLERARAHRNARHLRARAQAVEAELARLSEEAVALSEEAHGLEADERRILTEAYGIDQGTLD